MFVYTVSRGEATEVVACSKDQSKLQNRMTEDVKEFINEIYGDDEDVDFLQDIETIKTTNFWSDEDDEYETRFEIVEVEEI